MKATIEFDDELYRRLKATAALRGSKVKELVAEGVRMVLNSVDAPQRSHRIKLPVVKSRKPGSVKLTNEMITIATLEEDEKELLRTKFNDLYQVWNKETGMHSIAFRKVSHPAFMKILAMGESVLPFIFEKMAERKGIWFQALPAITGENPAEGLRDSNQATTVWLNWAKERDLL